jgi:hypothetical protein
VNTYGPPDAGMIEYYTKLASLRRSLVPLRTGSTRTLFTNANLYAFARVAPPNQPVIVVLNKSAQVDAAVVPVRGLYPNGARLVDQLAGGFAQVGGGALRAFAVPPRSGLVFVGTS